MLTSFCTHINGLCKLQYGRDILRRFIFVPKVIFGITVLRNNGPNILFGK